MTGDQGGGTLKLELPATLIRYRHHMHIFHAVWVGDVKTVEEMIEAHDTCHEKPFANFIQHEHTDPAPPPAWQW